MKATWLLLALVGCQSQPTNRIVTSDPNRAVLCTDLMMLEQFSAGLLGQHGASQAEQMGLAASYAQARKDCPGAATTTRGDAGVGSAAGTP